MTALRGQLTLVSLGGSDGWFPLSKETFFQTRALVARDREASKGGAEGLGAGGAQTSVGSVAGSPGDPWARRHTVLDWAFSLQLHSLTPRTSVLGLSVRPAGSLL